MVAATGLDVTMLVTLIFPSSQIWPPPGRHTWQYRLTWTLFVFSTIGFLIVGGLDAGTLGLEQWLGEPARLIVGSLLFAVGTGFASYAMGVLGRRGGLGLEAELVTSGPFAVSRNPGYLGDLTLMLGYTILTDSRLAGIIGLVGAVWFLLAPFAEEALLEAHYGEAYRRYKEQHPRWLLSFRRRGSHSA